MGSLRALCAVALLFVLLGADHLYSQQYRKVTARAGYVANQKPLLPKDAIVRIDKTGQRGAYRFYELLVLRPPSRAQETLEVSVQWFDRASEAISPNHPELMAILRHIGRERFPVSDCPPLESKSVLKRATTTWDDRPTITDTMTVEEIRTTQEWWILNMPLDLPPKVHPRETWDKKYGRIPKNLPRNTGPYESIVIHCSGGSPGSSPTVIPEVHINVNGWSDIGYHYIVGGPKVAEGSSVYEGRSLDFRGAHAGSGTLNDRALGICVIGTFAPYHEKVPTGYRATDPASVRQPTLAEIEQLVLLIHTLKEDHPTINKIYAHCQGHGTVKAIRPAEKECPGEGMFHIIAAIQERFFK